MWKETLLKAILYAVVGHYAQFMCPRGCDDENEACRLRQMDRLCWDGTIINALGWLVIRQLRMRLWDEYKLELIPMDGELAVLVKLRNESGQWLTIFPIWKMSGKRYNQSFFQDLENCRCKFHKRKHPELAYLAPFNNSQVHITLESLKNLPWEVRDPVSFTYYRLVLSSTFFGKANEGRREIPIVALFMADPEAFHQFFTIVSDKVDRGEWYKEEDLIVICNVVEKILEFIWTFRSGALNTNERLWEELNIGYVDDIVNIIEQRYPDEALLQKEVQKTIKAKVIRWHELIHNSCDRIFSFGQLIPLVERIERCAPKLRSGKSMKNIRYYQEKLSRKKLLNPCMLSFSPTGPN